MRHAVVKASPGGVSIAWNVVRESLGPVLRKEKKGLSMPFTRSGIIRATKGDARGNQLHIFHKKREGRDRVPCHHSLETKRGEGTTELMQAE